MAQQEATLLLRIKEAGQEILDRFVITLGDVIDLAKSVASALYATIEAYREEEKAINQLTQAMIQQGVYTSDLRAKYLEQAAALQDLTTYGDDQIVNAQRILQSMIGQQEVTEGLTRATLDFAAAKGVDLASAAELVGKAIASDTNMLSRYGIQVEQSTSESQKLANVVNALNSKFEGQAEAAADSLGKIDRLKNVWGDFLEGIGAALTPFAVKLTNATIAAVKFATSLLPQTFSASKNSVKELRAEFDRLGKQIESLNAQMASEKMFGGDSVKNLIAGLAAKRDVIAGELAKVVQMEAQSAQQSIQIQRDKQAQLGQLQQEKAIADQDIRLAESQMLYQTEEENLQTQLRIIDQMIANEQSAVARKKLVQDRGRVVEKLAAEQALKQEIQLTAYFGQQKADMLGAFSELAVALNDGESKALFLVSKGLALAQAWILTQVASLQALASLPYPANLAAAANIETIGYIRMAAIGATAIKGLAEGGIVQARPGGGVYQIGEAGRDEAVIPLDDPRTAERLGMGGHTFVFNGPVLGDEEQAMEFARVLDRKLLQLRQRNESVSFDEDVI